jgi:hypothetical protein
LGAIRTRLGRELAQRILGSRELARPVIIVEQLLEQPLPHPILFFGRQCRKPLDGGVQRSGHEKSIADGSAAQNRGRCVLKQN